jgi:cell division protein FtsB
MDDITERLRDLGYGGPAIDEAVAEIERLRSRVAELEAENKKLQDLVSDMAMDELSRLGQELNSRT